MMRTCVACVFAGPVLLRACVRSAERSSGGWEGERRERGKQSEGMMHTGVESAERGREV